MQDLNTFLNLLTEEKKLHISITDISGILEYDKLKIMPKYTIHSKIFCDTAKKTAEGYNLCMYCKKVCNKISVKRKKSFSGLCAFGIYEIVYPVVIENEVKCIIYIGNIITDINSSMKKLKSVAPKESLNSLSELIYGAEFCSDSKKYFPLAEIISDYIKALYSKVSESRRSIYHTAVQSAIHSIEMNFYHPLTLKSIADTCFINEKYFGRLFKEQVGKTFHEYLNEVRLENAYKLLSDTNKNVLEVAFASGFNSASYFTRIFKEKYKINPRELKNK